MDRVLELIQKTTTPTGWEFVVRIGDNDDSSTVHDVVLDNEYYQSLTNGEIVPKELVRRSFEFLLKNEPKESILKSFNIQQINDYFPEYEKIIQGKLK